MRLRLFAILIFVLTTQSSLAQKWSFELWHEGRIVLVTGDTLKGLVKYDLQQDLVQFDVPNVRTEAFTARKVLFFEIFDTTVHKYRRFFALPFNATAGYKTPVFFELLEEGPMTLLSREALEYRTYSSPYYIGSYTRLVLVNKFFFLDEHGDINEFTGNKNDLLDMMGRKSDKVEKYMKSERLKFDDKYDLSKIVAYYNSLHGS